MTNQIDETAEYVDEHGNSLWGKPRGTPSLADKLRRNRAYLNAMLDVELGIGGPDRTPKQEPLHD
jgi:hypothetical protein